ncbi:Uma2 family endonuclease [Streptomyces vilmorinianum]|uniref:Uma2 family endonuclease n=1 Tax=Streptomyces vilmorinianum TaxID=3051092 RepID=UPI0020C820E2|nr:Uma2 family endonuclease [Streptomyces vilmorinianum]
MTIDPQHLPLLEEAQRIAPKGVKVEYTDGTIIMQAAPTMIHQRNLFHLRRQFDAHCPAGYVPTENTDLGSPYAAKLRNPDLSYLPDEVMEGEGNTAAADLALIAVEIVSPSNPENDWVAKLSDYAVMRIPLYLIVDARDSTVTLFSEPNHDKYHTRTDRKFGETIRIPGPFGFDLDLTPLNPYH